MNEPFFFLGEMIFPWMFDDFAALRPFKESAQILSEKFDWPVLYNLENLKANRVPAAAMCYYEDMYGFEPISLPICEISIYVYPAKSSIGVLLLIYCMQPRLRTYYKKSISCGGKNL